MALIAATSLPTADYFAINSLPDVFDKLNLVPKDLGMLETLVSEKLAGRPGGSVSLAVGMTYVFHKLPGASTLMSYWYHFCIMFEALFILTTIDSGTRIGRYLLQDLFGKMYKPLANRQSRFNLIFFSALMSLTWGALLYSGNISTIWPLFGVANQSLAAIAFAIGTTVLLEMGKKKYTPITIIPMIFISIITITASFENVFGNYIPNGKIALTVLSFIIMVMLIVMLYECIKSWIKNWNKNTNNKLENSVENII
jgi:carbon starvation protein